MQRGTIEELRQAAALVDHCRIESWQHQVELEDIALRLKVLAEELAVEAVLKVAEV